MAGYRLQHMGYVHMDGRTDGCMDRETCQLKYYFRYDQLIDHTYLYWLRTPGFKRGSYDLREILTVLPAKSVKKTVVRSILLRKLDFTPFILKIESYSIYLEN